MINSSLESPRLVSQFELSSASNIIIYHGQPLVLNNLVTLDIENKKFESAKSDSGKCYSDGSSACTVVIYIMGDVPVYPNAVYQTTHQSWTLTNLEFVYFGLFGSNIDVELSRSIMLIASLFY